jgi:hypothetical protein
VALQSREPPRSSVGSSGRGYFDSAADRRKASIMRCAQRLRHVFEPCAAYCLWREAARTATVSGILTASVRSRLVSHARNTSPIPPKPSAGTIS